MSSGGVRSWLGLVVGEWLAEDDPVDDVEDEEDNGKELSRELVDLPRLSFAVDFSRSLTLSWGSLFTGQVTHSALLKRCRYNI